MPAPFRFIEACRGRPVDCTPVWLMRQAGRYQASYRRIRERVSFFELCSTPELAAQVTVDAVEQLGVDAGIIFSDILVLPRAMGAPMEITDKGPVLEHPIATAAEVAALEVVDPVERMSFVMEAIRLTLSGLGGRVPLIGFAGAPFTLACYLVEGKHSRDFNRFKRMMVTDERTAHALLEKLTEMVSRHLRAQVEAGCHAVQLFDSWAGILSPADYRRFVLPYSQRIFASLADLGVPRLHFGTATSTLLELLREAGADVVGLDWRVDIGEARRRLGQQVPVQGNLDPCLLFAPRATLEARVRELLSAVDGAAGHIFNLGHGVLPETPEENARLLVEQVHRLSAR